jgi:hypothetical protein
VISIPARGLWASAQGHAADARDGGVVLSRVPSPAPLMAGVRQDEPYCVTDAPDAESCRAPGRFTPVIA